MNISNITRTAAAQPSVEYPSTMEGKGAVSEEKIMQAAQTILNSTSEIKVSTTRTLECITVNISAAAKFSPEATSSAEISNYHNTIVPFGTLLGTNKGVIALSNGTTARISQEMSHDKNGRPSGMKWQCVEYGRRYLHEAKGYTFESVHGAHNIWDLETLTNLKNGTKHEFLSMKNGRSKEKPFEGALLIYPMQDDCPFGHVAVIVEVNFDEETGIGHIRIGEQNWANTSWEGRDYSRELPLTRDNRGRYTISDDSEHPILGWKAIGEVSTEE